MAVLFPAKVNLERRAVFDVATLLKWQTMKEENLHSFNKNLFKKYFRTSKTSGCICQIHKNSREESSSMNHYKPVRKLPFFNISIWS